MNEPLQKIIKDLASQAIKEWSELNPDLYKAARYRFYTGLGAKVADEFNASKEDGKFEAFALLLCAMETALVDNSIYEKKITQGFQSTANLNQDDRRRMDQILYVSSKRSVLQDQK